MPPSSTLFKPNDLLATVEQTLVNQRMLDPGDRVLVAVSGGSDSMALLHLLIRLAPDLKIQIGVAHLNHCLRGASADREAEMVRHASAALRYPCHIGRANVLKVKQKLGLSLEEAARRVRYAFLKKTMIREGFNKLALGHQSNDNAEQVLIALLRGTGPRGLSGIAPVREGYIIRPLIDARRSQIQAFVKKENIACVSDKSNDDHRFLRNRIRHHLLPHLASAYNPRIHANLIQLADVMRTEEAWIDSLVTAQYKAAVLAHEKGTITLSAEALNQAHPALARRLVRKAIADLTGTLRRITFFHVQSVLHLLTNTSAEKELHLPGGVRTRRTDSRLTLMMARGRNRRPSKPAGKSKPVTRTTIFAPFPAVVEIAAMDIGMRFCICQPKELPPWVNVDRNQAYFDMARIVPPLTIRPAIPGDRFTPLGAPGSQKLKKYFVDHGISRRDRDMALVLTDSQRIIWLVGQRIDDLVRVTTKTSQVLGVEYFLLDTR